MLGLIGAALLLVALPFVAAQSLTHGDVGALNYLSRMREIYSGINKVNDPGVALLAFPLCQNDIGGRTLAWSANPTVPAGFAISLPAKACTDFTSKFDGSDWTLISTAGGGGRASPSGAQGNLQMKNTAASASVNDNGTAAKVGEDRFAGANPWFDIRAFGARSVSSVPTTTCNTSVGSTSVTLGEASTFVNGDGFVCRGGGATLKLSTPNPPTVVASNVTGPTGTGQTTANSSGAATYRYCVVAESENGGFTPCSAVTSIANGPARLGPQTAVNWSSWTQSAQTVTVTTATPHNYVVGTYFVVQNESAVNGWYEVASVIDANKFTFTTQADTRLGASTGDASSTANSITWMSNHITWPEVSGAMRYFIYGRTAGSMALIGVSYVQSSTFSVTNVSGVTTVANMFDDYGSTLTPNILSYQVQDFVPLTPPISGKNGDLVGRIASGAGTTRIVVSVAATNAVTGAVFKLDNAPNIKAAMQAAAGGTVYIPNTGGIGSPSFVTNSVLDFGSTLVSVIQAGILQLNDTVILRQFTNWTGQIPLAPIKNGSFAPHAYPLINSDLATPFFYFPNQTSFFSYLSFTRGNNPTFGEFMTIDGGGAIPSSHWNNLNFLTGGNNDYMTVAIHIREDGAGGANFHFSHINMISGPGNAATGTNTSCTPIFIGEGTGNPQFYYDIMLNRRTIYMAAPPQGISASVDVIYDQQGNSPMFVVKTGNGNSANLQIRNHVLDTMGNPLVKMLGPNAGYVTSTAGNSPGNGFPLFNATAGSTVFGSGGTLNGGGSLGSYMRAIDGLQGTNANNFYSQVTPNGGIGLGALYAIYAETLAQGAPTAVVQPGGSIPSGNHSFQVAPVFASGGEGPASSPSNFVTTSSGNQTVQITWTAVAGAIGYDVYDSGFSIGCAAPLLSGGGTTSYTWSGSNPAKCGQSMPTSAGSGPTGLNRLNVWSPQITIPSADGNGRTNLTMTTGTATRAISTPDASGTILLDSTLTSAAGLAPAPFDNFNRANGGLGSNWTSNFQGNGSLSISGNAVIGGNGSANTNSYWTANTFLNDQYCEVTIASVPVGTQIGCSLRNSGTTNSTTKMYQCVEGNGSLQLWKILKGALFSISNTPITAAVGDRLHCTVVGNQITLTSTSAAGVTTTLGPSTDLGLTRGAPGIVSLKNSGRLVNWTGGSLPKNSASVTTEQEFVANQHINGALTVAAIPFTTTGTALTKGTIYAKAVQIGAVGAQLPATVTVASGTATLGTGAIASGACAKAVTVAATAVATTDVIQATFNSDPTVITGYAPSATGSLDITSYPTTGNVNFKVCNSTGGSITPGAAKLNWRVVR